MKPKPIRPGVPESSFGHTDRAAQRGLILLRPRIREALEALDAVPRAAVEEAIRTGTALPVLTATVAWEALRAQLLAALEPGGPVWPAMRLAVEGGVELSPVPLTVGWEQVAPAAEAWLEVEGGRLVTTVTEETRQAINDVVREAFSAPLTRQEAARRILGLRGFGLNRPQIAALINYTQEIMAGASNPESPFFGISARRADQLIERRHRRMLRQRASLIAQTEVYDAGQAAQSLLWEEAAAAGDLPRGDYVQEWLTRLVGACPRCRALDGAITEIGGVFESRPVASGTHAGRVIRVAQPTVHPRCYCSRRLVRRGEVEAVS